MKNAKLIDKLTGLELLGLPHNCLVLPFSQLRGRRPGRFAALVPPGFVFPNYLAHTVTSRRLLESDRLVVDGTLIKAWASHKSFVPTDSDDSDSDFRGTKRSNKTHRSKTDPDARLMRKGYGQESMMCHLGHIIVDSVSGIVKACRVSPPCGLGGNAEVLLALEMADEHMQSGQTLVADRGYDEPRFVHGLRTRGIRAHCRAKSSCSALDGRTTRKDDYRASMRTRYKPEPVFGWIKAPGRMRQTVLRSTSKVEWEFHLYCLAYNLKRMAK